jgi:hypothetical protein
VSTDEAGEAVVPESLRERYCVASIASGEWTLTGSAAFFARGRQVLEARRGCAVFVRIPSTMESLIGLPCVLTLGNRPVDVPLEGLTTLVGHCGGGLVVLMRVGEHQPRPGTSRFIVPKTGRVVLDFVSRDSVEPTLVIEGPKRRRGDAARFRFVPTEGEFKVPIDVRRPDARDTTIAIALPPGDYDFLGTWAGSVCHGRVVVAEGAGGTRLAPEWDLGETVTLRSGDGADVTDASLQLTPPTWRQPLEDGVMYAPTRAGMSPGMIVLDDRVVYARRFDWWGSSVVDGASVTWAGVPRGAALAHRLSTSSWVRRTVIDPGWTAIHPLAVSPPEEILVSVEPAASDTRIAVGQRFDPDVEGPIIAIGRPVRGVARILLGMPENWSRGLELRAETVGQRGQAIWQPDDSRRVTINLASVGAVRHHIEVVDADGEPVVGAPVSISRHEQGPIVVPTDARGRAFVDLPRGQSAFATVGGAEFDSGFSRLVDGEIARIRARRIFSLELENQRTIDLRGVVKIEPSRQSGPDEPVTILAGGVLRWGRLAPGTYRIRIVAEDGSEMFSDQVEVGPGRSMRVVIR